MHSWSKISRRQFLRAFGIFALVPEAEAAEVKEFNITLRRYHFIPPTIEVNQGDRVRINLMSEDVDHGFYLDGYDINTKVSAFKRETIEFTADRAGSFQMRCSVTCGVYHPIMRGKLTVRPNYRFWSALAFAVFIPFATLLYLYKAEENVQRN